MANEQNLIPSGHKFTLDEAKKGADASAKSRRLKKTMRELAIMMGNAKLSNKQAAEKISKMFDLDLDDVTHDVAIVAKHMNKAENGDVQSARYISDLKGEMKQAVELTGADGKPLIPEDNRTQAEKEAEIARLLNKGE